MADVNRGNRPLSPHLTLVSTLLLIWWLLAASSSDAAFAVADYVITSWFGDIVMVLSLWALWYHTLGGVRHLIWDTGRGLELKTAERMGWMMIIGSLVLTALTVFSF